MVQARIVGLKALRDRMKGLAKPGPITQRLHDQLSSTWKAGAAKFVTTAVENIRVDTGMSAATLFPLARVVRRGSIGTIRAFIASHGSSGRVKKDRPEFFSGRRRNPPRLRSIQSGDREGEKAFTITFGTRDRPVFSFTFRTVVFQFAVHEPEQMALTKGDQAFETFIRRRFVEDAKFVIRSFLRRPLRVVIKVD